MGKANPRGGRRNNAERPADEYADEYANEYANEATFHPAWLIVMRWEPSGGHRGQRLVRGPLLTLLHPPPPSSTLLHPLDITRGILDDCP